MRTKTYDALCGIIILIFLNQFSAFATVPGNPGHKNQTENTSLTIANDTLTNPSPCQMGLPILDDDCTANQEFPINVINPPGNVLGTDVILREVRIIIGHEWDLDLDMFLISPSGQVVTLSTDNGDTGDNYGDPTDVTCSDYTTFLAHTTPEACIALSVEDGLAPFIGDFLPEGSFSEFNDGTDPDGIWILKICDDAGANEGTLEFAELVFEPVSCITPSEIVVLAIDSTSVTLNWTPGNFCNNSIVEFGTNIGFMPGTGNTANGGDNATPTLCPPITLTNLDPNTTYELYVREFCGGGDFSENSCPILFTTSCSPPPATLFEDFDDQTACETICGSACPITGTWRNSMLDGFDWTVHSGSTISSLTGPSDDISGGGNYIYTEASGTSCQNETAHLISNCIQVNSSLDTCDLSFFYHMFGGNSMNLTLEISKDGGLIWDLIWSENGNKGDRWIFKYIDLSAYDGEIVQLRFGGHLGSNSRADMAIDEITFYGSQDLGPGSLTYYADMDGDGYGNSNMFFRTCFQIDPPGFSEIGGDCDDEDDVINPGAPETPCDNFDINCNGHVDEFFLFPPFVDPEFDTVNVCSGETAILEVFPQLFGDISWFETEMGGTVIHTGQTFSPTLPVNNTPDVVYLTFYAEEQNFFGCISESRTAVTVGIYPNPDISTNDEILICAGEIFDLANLNILDATQASGTFEYYFGSINLNIKLDSSLISPQNTTAYTILKTTEIGCQDTLMITANVKPGPEPFIFGDPTLCRGTSTSLSAVDIGGSDPPLTYAWNTGSNTSNTTANSTSIVGDETIYVVSITASDGCVGVDSFTVTTIGSIQNVSVNSSDVTTCEGSDGAINLAILGGIAPFNYNWKGPNGISGSGNSNFTSFSISDLIQGAYSITITDNADEVCPFVIKNTVVNGPSVVIQDPILTQPKCFGSNDGSIFIDVIGTGFSIFWDTGDTTELISGLTAGNYKATIIAGDCITQIDVDLPQPAQLTATPNIQHLNCPNGNDGKINLTVFGGTAPYSYNWQNGTFLDSLTNLTAGNYLVTVSDIQDCETVLNIEVNAPDPIQITLSDFGQVSCFDGRDGFMEVQVSGGTPLYSYLWDTDNTTSKISFLDAGNYFLTVTDDHGCTSTESFTMTQPTPIQAALSKINNATCIGIDDGSIDLTVDGGIPPYDFIWNNGFSDQNIDGLAPGEYWVEITDANDCSFLSDTFLITSPTSLDFTKNTTPPFCHGINNGQIVIVENTITGGNPPFDFSWSNGDSGPIIKDLSTGEYIVTITDASGCFFYDSTTLNAGQPIDIQINTNEPACFQTNTGSIGLTAIGGIPPYSILWNTNQDDFNINMLPEGNYWATVTDNVGCFLVSDTVKLTDPAALLLDTESLENNFCAGGETGSIDVTPDGGTPPYNYLWSNAAQTQDISGLAQGDYTLTLTDANSCPLIQKFTVTEPAPIQLETSIVNIPKCDLDPIDSVCIIPSGGLIPYQFLWNTGDTTDCLVQAPTGEYSVTVTDEMGCSEVMESVKYPDPIEPLSIKHIPELSQTIQCFDDKKGVLTVEFVGGTAPYEYNWNHGLTGTSNEDTLTITGLQSGLCSVTIVDSKGCDAVSSSVQVGQASLLMPVIDTILPVKCFGGADGKIDVEVSGGTAPYMYHWEDDLGNFLSNEQDLDSLMVGDYSVTITDSIGCEFIFNDRPVSEPEKALTISAFPPVIKNVSCFGLTDGFAQLFSDGGVQPYNYNWENGSSGASASNLGIGEYGVTVTDANFCVLVSEVGITGPDTSIYLTSSNVENVTCFGGQDGNVFITVDGGWSNYSFQWDDPMTSNTQHLFNAGAGVYSVEITDDNNCKFSETFEITEPDQISVSFDITDETSTNLGSITTSASGGNAPYSYDWSTGEMTDTLQNLTADIYQVTVTDSDGCTVVHQVEVQFINFIQNDPNTSVSLYPNPTSGRFLLEFESLKQRDLRISISDILGREVFEISKFNVRKEVFEFDLTGETAGVYWLRIEGSEGLVFVQKVVLTN